MVCRLTVRGRVQGVRYRGRAGDQARAPGLSGWVRNRRDGSVEVLVSGPDEAVGAFIVRCREGPPGARAERVEVAQTQEAAPAGIGQRPTL